MYNELKVALKRHMQLLRASHKFETDLDTDSNIVVWLYIVNRIKGKTHRIYRYTV